VQAQAEVDRPCGTHLLAEEAWLRAMCVCVCMCACVCVCVLVRGVARGGRVVCVWVCTHLKDGCAVQQQIQSIRATDVGDTHECTRRFALVCVCVCVFV